MEYCSVEHRKKVAEKYNLEPQEIIDLPRDKFEIFVSGLEIGEKHAAHVLAEYLKKEEEYQKLEKEHLGDPDKKTGIYSKEENSD